MNTSEIVQTSDTIIDAVGNGLASGLSLVDACERAGLTPGAYAAVVAAKDQVRLAAVLGSIINDTLSRAQLAAAREMLRRLDENPEKISNKDLIAAIRALNEAVETTSPPPPKPPAPPKVEKQYFIGSLHLSPQESVHKPTVSDSLLDVLDIEEQS